MSEIKPEPTSESTPESTAEPTLPVLPESLLTNKPPLSGICPSQAMLLMFLVALPISLILGIIAHYLGIVAGYIGALVALLPSLLASVCGFVVCVFVIFAITVIAAVFFGYPVLVGFAGGEIVGQLGKKGHCRNPQIAGWAGALNGIFIYLGHSIVALLVYGGLHPLTVTTDMFESLFDVSIQGTPWWMLILVALEFGLVIFGAFSRADEAIAESAYCETHGVWYTDWKPGKFPIETADAFAMALQTQDVSPLAHITKIEDEETYPYLLIRTRGCPASQSCDVEIDGMAYWQETKVDKQGKTSTDNKSKPWFDVMAPAAFGYALESTLALGEKSIEKRPDPSPAELEE